MAKPYPATEKKISPAFEKRLAALDPGEKVRAVVLLHVGDGNKAGRRPSRGQRQTAIKGVRQALGPALAAVDQVLQDHGGKREESGLGTLGGVPIETTTAGIHALASSDRVKAILEDQPISLLAPS